ncbi:cilia- and flagella-associated protein 91 [Hirundo rustica]|uniref:cilia- and flagella-associated protein 91 n=1 Tax=Hirundo rustica TaxID=43150 RepID=UPI001A94AA35|nr:cilia- and flagella-associated protein 91 [Hirundo rustica]XP_039913112.1 cilia- and flagella-associated protein 91 [Hirundo rustica]XP_039913113.1 cilia- and flagella-associated protein 91 [Hirundo rustica]XP_058275510.1 cilia- and flagella-associated protein 91 [Hirundo rustica]
MATGLIHFPGCSLCVKGKDPMPAYIARRWRAQQRLEALQQLAVGQSSLQIPRIVYEDPEVDGRNRYKYFGRPLSSFKLPPAGVPESVAYIKTETEPHVQSGHAEGSQIFGLSFRTLGTQTDYRDGEAQTDPYSPEYVVRSGSVPEILTLATLTWGRGLPAGQAEMEIIDRIREKRAWEAALPPMDSPSNVAERLKMLEAMERKEWAYREEEIEKLQKVQMEVFKKLLQKREENQKKLDAVRLKNQWQNHQKAKEEKIRKIQHDCALMLRKLIAKRKNWMGKLERRDIIKEYNDFSSQTYAPLSRIGFFPDSSSDYYAIKSFYLNTFEGLCELEKSVQHYTSQIKINVPKPKSGYIRKSGRLEAVLAQVHQALLEKKNKAKEPKKPPSVCEKVESPVPKPPTLILEKTSVEQEEIDLAVICLQKLLRGRALQNMTFEGKEKRLDLIQELRTTHALQEDGQLLLKAQKQMTLSLQRQQDSQMQQLSALERDLAVVEGRTLANMLDFLAKELVRLQEEQKIHALTMLAERQRRMREAEESGRRQLEESRREEEDALFRQVVNVQDRTIDTYLEDIILSSMERTAEEQAREEIQKRAVEINDIAYEMESRRTRLQSEEIVAELVYNFLIPEAEKSFMRERVRQSQRKHIYAAHRIIHGGTERALAGLAPHQEASATKRKEDSPAGTASTAPSGTAAGPSAADSTHPATVAHELGQGFPEDPAAS